MVIFAQDDTVTSVVLRLGRRPTERFRDDMLISAESSQDDVMIRTRCLTNVVIPSLVEMEAMTPFLIVLEAQFGSLRYRLCAFPAPPSAPRCTHP